MCVQLFPDEASFPRITGWRSTASNLSVSSALSRPSRSPKARPLPAGKCVARTQKPRGTPPRLFLLEWRGSEIRVGCRQVIGTWRIQYMKHVFIPSLLVSAIVLFAAVEAMAQPPAAPQGCAAFGDPDNTDVWHVCPGGKSACYRWAGFAGFGSWEKCEDVGPSQPPMCTWNSNNKSWTCNDGAPNDIVFDCSPTDCY